MPLEHATEHRPGDAHAWWFGDERRHDLFGGDMLFWRFYQCWLGSIGMLDTSHRTSFGTAPLEAPLSPEGRSVMLMLQATREPAWERMPMAEVVEAVAAAGRGADGGREAALREFERSVGFRRHIFARERVGRTHLVTLPDGDRCGREQECNVELAHAMLPICSGPT